MTVTPAAASWSAARAAAWAGSRERPAHGPTETPDRSPPTMAASLAEPGRIGAVRVQIDGTALFGGDLQDGLRVPRRVRVEVGTATDRGGPHLHRVAQHGQVVGARNAGEQTGYGDRGQFDESAQRTACLQHGFEGGEALDGADPHVCAQCGGAVAELQQSGLGGAALDVLGAVRHGPRGGVGARTIGGQRGVAVGVGFGRGGEQQISAQVHPWAGSGQAARGADGLDAAAAEPYVHDAAVRETGAAEHQGAGLGGGGGVAAAGRIGRVGGMVVRLPRLAVGHRAPGKGYEITQSETSLGACSARFEEERNSRTGVALGGIRGTGVRRGRSGSCGGRGADHAAASGPEGR